MKILLIGAAGTVGSAIETELGQRHDLVRAGRSNVDVQVDIADPASIRDLYRHVGKLDAVICAAGSVVFKPLAEMAPADFELGLRDKLMGQVNLVLLGQEVLNEGGSFTLTTGILSQSPIASGASASLVNGAVDAFVRSAAIELPRGLRINSVSPTVLVEALSTYGSYFRGFKAVPGAEVALAYSRSVEGRQTGQNYQVGY
ncbi:short chain dehydrogenase [Pseudomonas sp. RIT-PI-S]|uniref:short chain dehydrogenase n=1 Tax=Pseudomonas sp. RIT-PI-S TaxID=3035295 RepID=UPI0021D7F207|nr:short chain dehydrogenase [Pseudomonas sp. RIT-PI-S]